MRLRRAFTLRSFTMRILREGRGGIFDNLLCRVKTTVSHLENQLGAGWRSLSRQGVIQRVELRVAIQLAIDKVNLHPAHF
jgi:hypothetical protein